MWVIAWNGEGLYRHLEALIIQVFLSLCNLLSVILILKKIVGFNLGEMPAKYVVVMFMLLYSLPHYFLLMHNKKYIKIHREYEDLTEAEQRKGRMLALFYALGSILFLFFSFFIQTI